MDNSGITQSGSAIVGIVLVTVATLAAMTVIAVIGKPGNEAVLLGLSGLVVMMGTGLVGLIKQGKSTHELINSRMTELLEITRVQSASEAVESERKSVAAKEKKTHKL